MRLPEQQAAPVELTPVNTLPRIEIAATIEEAARLAAGRIVNIVNRDPYAAITYATGQTMIPVYAEVARLLTANGTTFVNTEAFHLDEYFPTDPSAAYSFVGYVREKIFGPFGIPLAQRHEMDGLAQDPIAEAARYEALLASRPISLAILGIGPGGHIGFNEQGTPFDIRTHVANLAEETIYRDHEERRLATPELAITQGIGNILDAEQIILVAYGSQKGEYLRKALHGPITPDCPASALRLAPDRVTLYLDQEAASVALST